MSQTDPPCQALEQYRSYLYVMARACLGPRRQGDIDASDVVQQTLMDAHQKGGQFRGATHAERAAWLRKILSRNLIDAMRRERCGKRDVNRQRRLEAEVDGSLRRAESWLAASQSSPSEHVAKHEQLVQLAAALTQLPDSQREAVIMRHLQDRSLTEVAQALGRSEAAAAGLVYRGLNRLHELLAEEEPA